SAVENLTAIWYKNPTFNDPVEPTWYSNLEGDTSDINATSGSGQANYEILGDNGIFSGILGIPNSSSSLGWINVTNPRFPAPPDFQEIDEYGCEISHTWIDPDDPVQSPSVHWENSITMPVNMSDYIITSASVSAEFNASVATTSGSGGTNYGVESRNDSLTLSGDYSRDYDKARFYVLISDLEDKEVHEIAWYQTVDLGQDLVGDVITSIPDTLMNTIVEEALIFYLTSLFKRDNFNFKITLGIRVQCIDNYQYDRDQWISLRIKSCNLTFTYEKKINQFSSISWSQDGDKITKKTGDTIITLTEAKLNFKYKINEDWTDLSPNSEIRIFINNNKLSETVKLSSASSNFTLAKLGGFDVFDIIPYGVQINLSIQVYLADEFHLGNEKIISIDEVYLNISYIVEFPDYQTGIEVYFNGINKTDNPLFQIPAKADLNITIKYPDNYSIHIPQAVVQLTGNITISLEEDEIYGQYTVIINTENLPIGEIYFNMLAHRINYEAQRRSALLVVSKINTENVQLFLDGEDKTSFPFLNIPLHKLLNITVKYKETTGEHISGATVQLVGEGVFENLNESLEFEQYSVIVNTTLKFKLGINNLLINAEKNRYQEKSINPIITVRKINTQIIPTSGSNNINIRPGESATISVSINNLDYNKVIKGLIVTYTWEYGEGLLTDDNNDGIYEEIFENVPVGTHSVNISAYGSDNYNFESYEIIISAFRPKQDILPYQILLIIGIIASVIVGGYLYAYQRILKYPKQVRKVRKYRKTLNKKQAPNLNIKTREKSFNSEYKKELKSSSRSITGKPAIKKSKELTVSENEKGKPQMNTGSKNQITLNTKISNNDLNNQKLHNKRNLIKIRKLRLGVLKLKNFRQFISIIIIAVLLFNFFILSQHFNLKSNNFLYSQKEDYQSDLRVSGQEIFTNQPWLNDTSFDNLTDPVWFASYGDLGDKSDVDAMLDDNNYANLTVIGETHTFSEISGTPNSSTSLNWYRFNNPEFPADPDNDYIDDEGCYVDHDWSEQGDQAPSVHWEKNVTMPLDMSDYIITSANLT
ncbi:MAG: hypothetical protein HWN81_23315, partial [Candidatus Lokiarchaeota archaeon]|nr:hypothetical protein [Candidatus Lokiarchaeota archaeon]